LSAFFHWSEFAEQLFANFFLVGFASQEVLYKGHIVLVDGARPANTCIPPSLVGNMPARQCGVLTPKGAFGSIKMIKFQQNHFFILKIYRKSFAKLILSNSNFA
jgi:hypothetical protein